MKFVRKIFLESQFTCKLRITITLQQINFLFSFFFKNFSKCLLISYFFFSFCSLIIFILVNMIPIYYLIYLLKMDFFSSNFNKYWANGTTVNIFHHQITKIIFWFLNLKMENRVTIFIAKLNQGVGFLNGDRKF